MIYAFMMATYSWLGVAWHIFAAIAAAAIAGVFLVIAFTDDRNGRVLGPRALLGLLAARVRRKDVPGQESPAASAPATECGECGTAAGALAGHLVPLKRLATTGEQRAVREPVTPPVAAALKDGSEDEALPVALQEPATDLTEPLYTDDSTNWRLMVGEIAGMGK